MQKALFFFLEADLGLIDAHAAHVVAARHERLALALIVLYVPYSRAYGTYKTVMARFRP